MRKKKVKFSPKLQSSSLDDIKKFVPKNALNTPVISNYNTLPASYQNGGFGEGGKPQAIVSSGQNIESLQRVLNNIYPNLNLSIDGDWGPATQAAYQKYKQEYSGSPALSNRTGAVTSLIGDIARKQFNKATGLETRTSPRSERELTAEQIAVLNRTAKDALASGRRYIDYPDYKTKDVDIAYRGEENNLDVAKRVLTDPAYQMKTTLGRADIVITPAYETTPSDTLAVDQYDFNKGSYGIEEKADIGFKEAWEKSKDGSAYKVLRNLAQHLGSDPGDPSSRQSIINIGS